MDYYHQSRERIQPSGSHGWQTSYMLGSLGARMDKVEERVTALEEKPEKSERPPWMQIIGIIMLGLIGIKGNVEPEGLRAIALALLGVPQ